MFKSDDVCDAFKDRPLPLVKLSVHGVRQENKESSPVGLKARTNYSVPCALV